MMKAAKIDYGGDKYPCVVRDISSTGARWISPILSAFPTNSH
jgi:hypothetical protein